MPATYAHYRLGQQARMDADASVRRIIDKYPQLYLIGVHGPDILFFYWPLFPVKITKMGYQIHHTPGKVFFERAKCVLGQLGSEEEREPYLAYLYGVLAHYALDVSCHFYVFDAIRTRGLSHTEIESEFDRALLLHDGKPTYRYPLTGHVTPTTENARIIKAFYPGSHTWQIRGALRGMCFFHRLFLAPDMRKRVIIFSGMRLIGQYHRAHGFVMNYRENPLYKGTTRTLLRIYPTARRRARQMFAQFTDFLKEGKELGGDFYYDFESDYHG